MEVLLLIDYFVAQWTFYPLPCGSTSLTPRPPGGMLLVLLLLLRSSLPRPKGEVRFTPGSVFLPCFSNAFFTELLHPTYP